MYDVPHLRFPEFSGEWERRLKDVCNIRTGNKNTQDKSDNGIYPFYVRSQIVERINSWTFDGEAILTAGDGVGVGKVFHYSTGKIGVHQRVYILSDFKCDGKYLYSYFAGNFYNRVKRMSAKNSVDSVRMEMIADMPIALPSIEEQKKIGHLLALLDDRIATQNKIIEDLKKLKSVIIDYAFTNNKDVEREQILLSDISTKITRKNTDNRISNVLSNSANQGVVPQSGVFDREIANEENISNYIVISYNDFVYNPRKSAIAPYGPINKYNGELKGVISPLYLCFRTHDINAEYLAWYFKSRLWHEYIYKNGDAGVRHDRVSIKDDVFFSMPLKIHSKLEQGRIANKLNKIESFVMHEIQYLSLLQTQKYFLLQQMFI